MKTLRNSLYFLVGVVLSSWVVFSHAGTFPATVSTTAKTTVYYVDYNGNSQGGNYSSAAAAAAYALSINAYVPADVTRQGGVVLCANGSSTITPGNSLCTAAKRTSDNAVLPPQSISKNTVNGSPSYYVLTTQGCVSPAVASGNNCVATTCPAGSSGPTLVNGVQTCTNSCDSSKTGTAQVWANAWAISSKLGADSLIGPKTVPGTGCDTSAQCEITNESWINCFPQGTPSVDVPAPIYCTMNGHQSGASCSSNSAPTAAPVIANHPPKCLATEGVLTSSSGTVACVASGTPAASTPTVVEKKTTTVYPDGSTAVKTTTTTTDPQSGATNVSDTTVTTGVGGSGSTAGQAGAVGTTSAKTDSATASGTANDKSKDQQGDCVLEPNAPHCKAFQTPGTDGLYTKKTKTVSSVVGDFKNGVMSSSIGSASTGFFTVSVPGGSCPAWSVDVPVLNVHLDVSQYFCTSTALSMMNLVGAVLIFIAAFVGFRWAIL